MTSDFESPTRDDIPTRSSSEIPWSKRIEYKSGKTPQVFAADATPDKVKAGFSHYDKKAGAKVLHKNFTASIVAMTFGVSGTVQDGNYYVNYFSNLVFDTRTQPIEVFHFMKSGDEWKKHVIASGFYNEFKGDLPDGVGYCKVLICWIHETQELVSINVSAQVEVALKEAIAEATATSLHKISIFEISKSEDRFWAIKFSGEFTKRTRDGKTWEGQGDMFFCPSFVAKVTTAEKFTVLAEMKQAVKEYIEATEDAVWRATKGAKPTPTPLPPPDSVLPPASQRGNFPDDAPPVNHERGPEPTDDLPF
jgi:hypothetical protein